MTGTLDLTLPWATLAGISSEPGRLGRLGPVTPAQASQLAGLATANPDAQWRIIVTSPAGQALAVTRIPRQAPPPPAPARNNTRNDTRAGAASQPGGLPAGKLATRQNAARSGARQEQDEPGTQTGSKTPPNGMAPRAGTGARTVPGNGLWSGRWTGLVGRVTLTIPQDLLALDPGADPGGGTNPPGAVPSGGNPVWRRSVRRRSVWRPILTRALRAAGRAAARAAAQADADHAAGGCAHTGATTAYRPPPRLHETVTARDLTCRFPSCRQPAWRGDLDHTQPYDQGGRTCACNLGGLCRRHHILKQHPRWHLTQPEPGTFHWTTPTGRTYLATPDTHPV